MAAGVPPDRGAGAAPRRGAGAAPRRGAGAAPDHGASGEPAVIGLDLGTTECKAAVLSASGRLLGAGHVPCSPSWLGEGRVEQDPRLWWSAAREAVLSAMKAASVPASAVQGIAVSSQGISFVPVDASGEPLANAISWLDTRAREQAHAILAAMPEADLFARTGKRASPAYLLPKLLWLRQHEPGVFAAARKFLMAHDYVVLQLTGETVTDHSLASGTALYDVRRQDWDPHLLELFGVPASTLPALAWSGSRVGALRPDAAAQLGLPSGIAVAVGGQDQKLAALAAGVSPTSATLSLGTACAISLVVDRPASDPTMRIPLFSFCLPRRWDVEGVIGTAGASLAWFRDALAAGLSHAQLDAEARDSVPGSRGVCFFPHLAGATSPHWREGALGACTGLSLATNRGDVARAVLEGVAYQARSNLSLMAEVAGDPRNVVVFGGGAKSALWCHILADVLAKPIGVTETVELASLGAGMAAAVGAGAHSSLPAAQAAMLGHTRWLEPDPQAVSAYDEAYAEYVRIEGALLGGGLALIPSPSPCEGEGSGRC